MTYVGCLKRYGKVIVWMFLIFLLSSIPNARINNNGIVDLLVRKMAHITEYAILLILFNNSLSKGNIEKRYVFSLIFTVLYAISDEFHQSFVPGRGPSLIDVGIDTLGSFLGLIYLKNFWDATPQGIKTLLS